MYNKKAGFSLKKTVVCVVTGIFLSVQYKNGLRTFENSDNRNLNDLIIKCKNRGDHAW